MKQDTKQKPIKHFKDLEVYTLSYEIAMNIFDITREFPKEELYSSTSQMVRSSRSISANIAEGWSKQSYENIFKKHLLDSMGSLDETKTWLNFSRDCKYISDSTCKKLYDKCELLGAKLYSLHNDWIKF